MAIGLLDIDRFKRFNDEHGHQAGDQLLRRTAQRWSQLLRPNDVIVRWGGEEFAVLLPDTSGDDATTVVERLRGAVPDGQTVSAGLTLRQPGEPADEAIRRADTLLYAAKQQVETARSPTSYRIMADRRNCGRGRPKQGSGVAVDVAWRAE